jgi:hypothetical protein
MTNTSLTWLDISGNGFVAVRSHSIQVMVVQQEVLSNYLKHSNLIQLSLHSISPVIDSLLLAFSLNTGINVDKEATIKLIEALKSNSTLTSLNPILSRILLFVVKYSNSITAIVLLEEIEDCIDRNKDLWRAIHYFIRTNDLEKLMTLLSEHTINLNSFNLSTDGDTILHSAAKSNDVKMIEFILQRISPSTKQRMIQMKNRQEKLPADLLERRWTPSTHSLFPLKFRQVVKAVLMLGAKKQDGTPYYPQTHFYKLPKDLLFIIIQYAVHNNIGNQ